jgi:hypothetical protein
MQSVRPHGPSLLVFFSLCAQVGCDGPIEPECATDPCTSPGESRCDGTQILECVELDPSCGAEWVATLECTGSEPVCDVVDGEATCVAEFACPDTPCVADEVVCDGDRVVTCEIDGDGCAIVASTVDCAETNQVCVDGPPATCEPVVETVIVGGYSYEVVVELDSLNPSGAGPFRYLEQNPTLDPATDEPTVYFRATTLPPITPPQASLATAVYAWSPSRGIEWLAQAGQPIPGGVGGFTAFAQLVINPPVGYGGVVAFVGDGNNLQRGIYRRAAGVVGLVADRNSVMPGGPGLFDGLGAPTIYGDELIFVGTAPGAGGYYRWNDGTPTVFVDLETPNPAADGDYTGVELTDFNGTDGLFFGYGAPLPGATYTGVQSSIFVASLEGGPHEVIATKETAMPDVDDRFTILTGGLFDGDGIFFHGRGSVGPIGPFGSIVHKGLYRWEDGTIETVVNTLDVMPGSEVTFSADFANGITSQYMATHGGDLLYRGVGTVGNQEVLYGLYLYRGATGQSEKVIDTTDRFDGKVMTDILMSRSSFQGDHFVVWIEFEDGSQGIYLGRPLD